jgi:ribose/xylose/arabinose/galactoside ABC-type transport system permease subunit
LKLDARALLRTLGPALGLAAAWMLFAVLAGRTFTSWANLQIMLVQTAVVGTAAVGATWIIVSGGIDLSVGSTLALGTMVIALLLEAGASPGLAALGGIASATLVGAAIGALVIGELGRVIAAVAALTVGALLGRSHGLAIGVASGGALVLALGWGAPKLLGKLTLSPFIVTLGLWGALRGLAKGLGDNKPIYPSDIGWLRDAMNLAPSGVFSVLPPGVCVLIAVSSVAALALKFTVFGRHALAVGSNEETARLCGVRVERVKLGVYMLGLACAGIASVLQFSYLSMGDPTTAQGYELKVIAAVVIGGASLSGGQGSVGGALIGALIMTVVDNGCTKVGLDNWVQELATGGIIVAAVALDRVRVRSTT